MPIKFKMKWIAIMLIIAWTSIVECGNIDFETCPEHGPATIDVVHDSYIKLSGNLECSFVIKPKSTVFVEVKIEDVNATNSQYISLFNGDTSKLCEYNEKEMFKYIIISTNLEVRKADIQATLKITPWPSTKINENYTQSSEIVLIPYQTGKSTLDLEPFLLDFVLPNRTTVTTPTLDTTTMSTSITSTTTTTLCTKRSSSGFIQDPDDNWCNTCKVVPYLVEDKIAITLSGKLNCSLLILPMNADEIKVRVVENRKAGPRSISIWTRNANDEEFRLQSTQQSFIHTEALNIVAAQVRLENIQLDAILNITPLKYRMIPSIQPKTAKPPQEEASTPNMMIIQIVILIVLGVIGIFLSACILLAIRKSKNQVVCVVSLSNLQNSDTQAQATSYLDTVPEASTSIRQEVTNVPSVPRSLPSYSECDFDQNSTCQEPPSYEEALKLNWV